MNSKSHSLRWGTALLLLSLAAACGRSRDSAGSAFKLVSGAAVPVQRMLIYPDSTVALWPAAHAATLREPAERFFGLAMATNLARPFITGEAVAPRLPVNLGTAGNFVILAKGGISALPTSAVTGDLGVSPAGSSFITGFSLTDDSTKAFSTSRQVIGKVYAADYAPPTPSTLTTAVSDMERAFVDAAERRPGVTNLGAGNIGGKTLDPGIYNWSTGLLIPTDVTLRGSATDIWIFQIAQDLTMGSAARVLLAGGALPKNVVWQVAGPVDLGTTAHCEGVVLAQGSVKLRTGASIKGRLLAQTAISIDSSSVVEPAQ